MKNNCVKELYSFEYDISRLKEIMSKYEFKQWTPYMGYDGDTSKFQQYEQIRHETLIEDNEYLQELVDRFNPILNIESSKCCFLKFKKGFEHKKHIDINRECVLYFPLSFDNSPTVIYDDNKIIEHKHMGLSILNVQKPHHAGIQSERDRYSFTISVYIPFNELKEIKNLYLPG
jgi:hypothetical protein